jgi:acetolactate synthase-1/2/3 large subunit
MGVALGAALAFRGTGKVCVSIQNDGDLLYTPGSDSPEFSGKVSTR